MIRTVWLAAICSVALGAVSVSKVTTAPPAISVEEGTVGADLGQEALIKADRLPITYARQEMPIPPPMPSVDPVVPDIKKVTSPVATEIVSRHWHDPNDTKSWAAKSQRTFKKGKSTGDPKQPGRGSVRTKRPEQPL